MIERSVDPVACECCGVERLRIGQEIYDADTDYTFYVSSSLYTHYEPCMVQTFVFYDNDIVTLIAVRYGVVVGASGPAFSVFDAEESGSEAPCAVYLTRDQALAHPAIQIVWGLADFLVLSDPDIHEHNHLIENYSSKKTTGLD